MVSVVTLLAAMLSLFMLNVILSSVILLGEAMQSLFMLNVIMLCVISLSAILLIVMACL
jgi:hypothetical protein